MTRERDPSGGAQASAGDSRELEAQLGSIFRAAPIGIGLVVDRIFAQVNDRFCELVGYSRDELIGQSSRMVYPCDEDFECVGRVKYGQIAEKGIGSVETRFRRKDGLIIAVLLSSAPLDPDEPARGVTFTVLDIDGAMRTEAALRRSESSLMRAQTAGGIGVWEWDLVEEMFSLSEEFTRIYGLGRRVYSRAEIREFVFAEDAPRIQEALQATLAGVRPLDVEHRILRQDDGEVRWIHARGEVIRSPGGKPERMVGTSLDITERKRAEEALRRERDRARTYLKIAGVMMVALDAEGRVTLINRKGCEILGYEEEEIIGKGWFDTFLPERLKAEIRTVFDRNMAGASGMVEYFENPVLRRDGEERFIAWHNCPLTDEQGRITGTLSSGEDITERKRAQDARAEAEALYRTLVEAVPAIIYTSALDEVFTTLYMSPQIEDILGVSPEVFRQEPDSWQRMLHPGDRERVLAELERSRASGETFASEYRMVSPDGRERWFRDEARVVAEARGTPPYLFGMMRDITDRKELEQQLRQAQKMEAVGQLAGGVAHDFNNILSAIMGFSELAALGLDPESAPARDLRESTKAVERASTLVRQLLAFSRRQTLDPMVLDAGELVAGMEKMLRRVIREDIELAFERAPDLGRVKVDPGQLEQIVLNLAINARDAMPDGGTLSIATANVELDQVYAYAHPYTEPGRYMRLSVSDTGVGMDAATRSRIFEPFFTTKEADRGTGLGLATVYGIVKQSGGSIEVHSRPGEGASFEIFLPRVDEAAAAIEEPVRPPPRGTETVLLVEDDSGVRSVAARILASLGYVVLETSNGPQALELAERREGPIDLLLTDVVMPGMNGRELARRLTSLRPGIAVVYTSGYTDGAISEGDLQEAGASFIHKPFGKHELARGLRDALDGG